ncbi:AAA family ATPase [Oceanirhabdus sp. W0125-5]|uniref:AAA family ATPase n=1 Tax=Oceanirhabdus sp. W0125-5 TaxID=2999116 RepID=UPI0022F2D9C1|nr:AAA family ATPase [Oceanirhabdus sp. W0125-5]WBW96449.1 AAA family ATPase [Oceanirhabdus sp. W0125-5]
MIIMVNGAFGVGKTSVANCLVKNIKNSMLYDPEEVGFLLRNIIPREIMLDEEKTDDFQDLNLWKKTVVMMAREIKKQYNRHLIVPMTIRDVEYFKYIYEGLKEIDDDIHHFCLTAPLDKIHSRLKERGDKPGSWSYKKTEECLETYKNYDFSEYIDTEKVSIEEVTKIIIDKVNNKLL